MIVFQRNQQLTKDDLNSFIRNDNGDLVDPVSITYAIYDRTGKAPVLVGNKLTQIPTRESVGYYWANIRMDEEDNLGEYEIEWTIKMADDSPKELFRQRFSIVRTADPVSFVGNVGGVAYHPGQVLGPQELYINLINERGNPFDPAEITYAIFDRTTGLEILVGSPKNTPVRMHVGRYYANYQIPNNAHIGDYLVRWTFSDQDDSPERSVTQEFAVVNSSTLVSSVYGEQEKNLIRRVRFLLRDNNPDRNYRFSPPDSERVIQNFTETFGFVWTDEELYEYLIMAMDAINNYPPIEAWSLSSVPEMLHTLVTIKAASFALTALSINWIHDEFDYSIAGVSLQIEKSEKYKGMSDKLEEQYDKALERYKDFGIKIVKGIQQPKYGVGVSSALGPYSGRGVQNRPNFVAGFRV